MNGWVRERTIQLRCHAGASTSRPGFGHQHQRRSCAPGRCLHDIGVTTVPIDPFLVATHLGVLLREEHYDGVEGYLLRVGSVAGIGINTSVEYKVRRRFTMAHELGHYCLSWHADPQYMWILREQERQFTSQSTGAARRDNRFLTMARLMRKVSAFLHRHNRVPARAGAQALRWAA